MESTTSKDVYSDSLLPSSFEESCKGQDITGLCYHVHVNHFPGGTRIVAQRRCCADGSFEEKSPLSDIPINSEKLNVIYNKEVLSQQAVWSTETNKVLPGRPRIVGRDNKQFIVIFCISFIIFGIMAGLYLCFNGLSSIAVNYDTARKIHLVQYEAQQAVNTVQDLYNIPAEYEERLIHVIGPLTVTKSLKYDECNVSVNSVILRRTFDRSHLYTRVASDMTYFFSEKWPQSRIDKDQICAKRGPEYESLLSLKDDEQIADEVKIGPLTLGHRLKEKFDEFVIVSDKLLKVESDRAIRVMYSDAGRSGNIHSVMGRLVNGTIESFVSLDYYDIILQRESEVSADEMIRDRVSYHLDKLDEENWCSYMRIGLGVLTPLTAFLNYKAVTKTTKKN